MILALLKPEAGHAEKLTNLESLPDRGFTFYCFPVKIKGASAGWIRAVAQVE